MSEDVLPYNLGFWVPKPVLIPHAYLRQVDVSQYYVEPKVNGIRCLVYILNGKVQLWNRHKRLIFEDDCPNVYRELCEVAKVEKYGFYRQVAKVEKYGIYDGELVYKKGNERLYLFDCVWKFDCVLKHEVWINDLPIEVRRTEIPNLSDFKFIQLMPDLTNWVVGESAEYSGKLLEFFNDLPKVKLSLLELEGIVLKKRGSPYLFGRSESDNQFGYWLKCRYDKPNG